jgi:hypothetical protein
LTYKLQRIELVVIRREIYDRDIAVEGVILEPSRFAAVCVIRSRGTVVDLVLAEVTPIWVNARAGCQTTERIFE